MYKEALERDSYEISPISVKSFLFDEKSDHKVRIYRYVSESSRTDLDRLVSMIKPSEAKRRNKEEDYRVSLVYPDSVYRAINQSCLRGLRVAQKVANVLTHRFPDSFYKPVVANVLGVGQYLDKVGLELSYPEFKDEQQTIATAMNQLLGERDVWNNKPHISIALGKVANLSNLMRLEESLPANVELSPANIDVRLNYGLLEIPENN